LSSEEKETASRAAALSKADLATAMVVEMTSLQGIMGGQYARMSGESEAVATAIAGQYEGVSKSNPGLALALADRLDSLIGLFAAGLAPKGSNDPFALRRTAIQTVENLIANEIDFDLRVALNAATPLLPVEAGPNTVEEVLKFINNRLETFLLERGIRTSVVRAVLAEQSHNPYAASHAAGVLNEIVKGDTWPSLLDAYARCARITRDQLEYDLDTDKFALPQEQRLLAAYQDAVGTIDGSIGSFVDALADLKSPISDFFDNIMVMDEDASIRMNRLALLQRITQLSKGIADLSYLEGF
jgi:glycyl-tRNA synthetase